MTSLGPFAVDIIGYVGLIVNLYSMSVKGERGLRIISAVANSLFVIYGLLISAPPVFIGGFIAVILHTYHLRRIRNHS